MTEVEGHVGNQFPRFLDEASDCTSFILVYTGP
jgi:hypothetical protein